MPESVDCCEDGFSGTACLIHPKYGVKRSPPPGEAGGIQTSRGHPVKSRSDRLEGFGLSALLASPALQIEQKTLGRVEQGGEFAQLFAWREELEFSLRAIHYY